MPCQGRPCRFKPSERQLQMLREIAVSRSEPLCFVQRAKIVVLAIDGLSNHEIDAKVGLGRHQIGLWRTRWRDASQALSVVEQTCDWELARSVRECLRDAPRPGSPGTFSPQQVANIVSLACQSPELSGRPINRWTLRELRAEALKRAFVPSISQSQVGDLLRTSAVRPHRENMWLNTTERDEEKFQAQTKAVCDVYLTAPAWIIHGPSDNGRRAQHATAVSRAGLLWSLSRRRRGPPPTPNGVSVKSADGVRGCDGDLCQRLAKVALA